MKRLLSALSLPALLLATMGVGPCGSQPLGSVDGGARDAAGDGSTSDVVPGDGAVACGYQGKTYPSGSTFPSADGCNTCSCDVTGTVGCTKKACIADAGVDRPVICTFGGDIYAPGEAFFDNNGCVCTCSASGVVTCDKSCPVHDAGAIDGGMTCSYQGVTYAPGSAFKSSDGCNTCSCTSGGLVACTLNSCPGQDAAPPPPACTFGQDQTCNENPVISSLRGTCLADGTCKCTTTTSPYTGRCLDPGDTSGKGCELGGVLLAVGDQGTCPDGCGTCTCAAPGTLKPNGDCSGTSCTDILFQSSATCLPESDWKKTATAGCAAVGKSLTKTYLNACKDPTLFDSGSYKCCETTLPCGNSNCKPGVEYCIRASANGADQLATCHPYAAGCSTCACARLEAAATLQKVPACASVTPLCTDGSTSLQPADTSATLVVWCMVP